VRGILPASWASHKSILRNFGTIQRWNVRIAQKVWPFWPRSFGLYAVTCMLAIAYSITDTSDVQLKSVYESGCRHSTRDLTTDFTDCTDSAKRPYWATRSATLRAGSILLGPGGRHSASRIPMKVGTGRPRRLRMVVMLEQSSYPKTASLSSGRVVCLTLSSPHRVTRPTCWKAQQPPWQEVRSRHSRPHTSRR